MAQQVQGRLILVKGVILNIARHLCVVTHPGPGRYSAKLSHQERIQVTDRVEKPLLKDVNDCHSGTVFTG